MPEVTLDDLPASVVVAPEVEDALRSGGPVVALESTIISHGLPRPTNLDVARQIEGAVRAHGAVPATIAIVDGVIRIGLDDAALAVVAGSDDVVKASVRDVAVVVARGGHGATTVASTAELAALVGIGVFATGGRRVHRGASDSFDESADLTTLGTTPITVVSAGVKSILDVAATLERLETLNVTVVGFGTDQFPGFYLADSGHAVPHRVDTPEEVAAVMAARTAIGSSAALLVANPLPVSRQVDPELHDRVLAGGLDAAAAAGVKGKDVTPFLLAHFHEASGGESLRANTEIILANAALAGAHRIGSIDGLRMSHVLVVGDLMVDVIVAHKDPIAVGSDTPARVCLTGGGSAANTACWLASLGEAPHLMAARGDDHFGELAAADLVAAGVTFVGPVLDQYPTGTCVVLVSADGERTMLPDRGANDRLPMSAIVGGLDPMPDWVHLSGYAILHEGSRNAGRAVLSAGIAGGAVASVDAASTAPIKAVGAEAFLNWIDGASLVFANDEEIDVLGGVWAVLEHVGAVVVKHGAAGATWTDGGDTLRAEGFPVDAIDSTGAGDAFAAGWIAAVRLGADPQAALADAVRIGATAVTQPGARPVAPPS